MVEVIVAAAIIGYTGFIIIRKTKDIKAGKSCCGGCSGCASREKCGK